MPPVSSRCVACTRSLARDMAARGAGSFRAESGTRRCPQNTGGPKQYRLPALSAWANIEQYRHVPSRSVGIPVIVSPQRLRCVTKRRRSMRVRTSSSRYILSLEQIDVASPKERNRYLQLGPQQTKGPPFDAPTATVVSATTCPASCHRASARLALEHGLLLPAAAQGVTPAIRLLRQCLHRRMVSPYTSRSHSRGTRNQVPRQGAQRAVQERGRAGGRRGQGVALVAPITRAVDRSRASPPSLAALLSSRVAPTCN